jgi:hypothetical protein
MRIIIDTNVVVNREQNQIVSEDLQELFKILNQLKHQILVHPLSVIELSKDKKEDRKEVQLSKIGAYVELEQPPDMNGDSNFKSILGDNNGIKNAHEIIDNNLIYCIYKDAADFLITEDKEILKKSEKLGIADRVFSVSESLEYFKKHSLYLTVKPVSPPALKEIPMHNLDLNDSFFDSLKEDYGEEEFSKWWRKKSKEGRMAWAYFKEGKLGALLIYKIEDEKIDVIPALPEKKRLKICTLKVTQYGYKIGELLVKLAVRYSSECKIDEIFLTHFTKNNDYFIPLIEEFGFRKWGKKGKEDLFLKKLLPDIMCGSPLEIQQLFYPSFYDGIDVKKFVIPIQPEFHNRLFTDYKRRQQMLEEFNEGFIIEGNTIKKAYLCHSNTKNVDVGDVLIFYRSHDEQALTTIGIVEKIFYNLTDPDVIERVVGKRSVYTRREIEVIAQKPTMVILFYFNFHFAQPIDIFTLSKKGIIKRAPQSIQKILPENYLKIKENGVIDKRFCINELKI